MESHKTILIVDDEEDVCLLLKRSLRRDFQTIATAYLVQEGLQAAERLKPDILFLDNNLPDGLGLEYIARFKAIKPEMYVVLFSALDLQVEARVAGADAFLGKPLDLGRIRQILSFVNTPTPIPKQSE